MAEQAEPSGNGTDALILRQVSKHFGGLRAVDDVNLTVKAGERRAIIGPNGAGKTTLFNLITGDLSLTTGQVLLLGRDISKKAPHERVALGLGRTYQITNLFPRLTVRQNIMLAAQGLSRAKFSLFRPVPTSGPLHEKVEQMLAELDLGEAADIPVNELSYGVQRQLEIALALATDPKVLLLDEPAAGLSPAERVTIATLIRRLPRSLTVVLIEHDMDLALGLVDAVSCLHFGQLIAEDTPDRIRENETIQEIYLGAH